MKIKRTIFLLILWLNAGLAAPVHYRLSLDTELYNRFHVEMTVSSAELSRLVFSMPIWMPGSYYVRNYGENVLNFNARNEQDSTLVVLKLSGNDWEVLTGGARQIRITYDVLADGHDFMGVELDSTGALIHGASTWMYVRGMEDEPVSVRLLPPNGWQVATALRRSEQANLFLGGDYHELADSPMLVGALRDTTFYLAGKEYQLVFRGKAEFDLKGFTKMVEKIITYQTGLMGHIPYERYVFLYSLLPGSHGGGGLEHNNSTTIGINATRLMGDVYSAASITAHEFFHLWNVKRLTSDQILPLRYDREARTTSLWWLEGVTSYYTALTLVRSGIWDEQKFTDHFEVQIRLLQENPDRKKTSLAKASWDVWENGYFSTGISYYNKGQLVGFLLDVMIRKLTDNKKSLDDVLLDLYNTYALNGKGFPDEAIQETVERISGHDFSAFFDRYVTGTVELPYKEILKLAGFDVSIHNNNYPSIGRLRFLGKNNRIYTIDTHSAAAKAGIRKEDEIVAINGETITDRQQYAKIIEAATIGDTLKIRVRREGVYLLYEVPVESDATVDCEIKPVENPDSQQLRIRKGILSGN